MSEVWNILLDYKNDFGKVSKSLESTSSRLESTANAFQSVSRSMGRSRGGQSVGNTFLLSEFMSRASFSQAYAKLGKASMSAVKGNLPEAKAIIKGVQSSTFRKKLTKPSPQFRKSLKITSPNKSQPIPKTPEIPIGTPKFLNDPTETSAGFGARGVGSSVIPRAALVEMSKRAQSFGNPKTAHVIRNLGFIYRNITNEELIGGGAVIKSMKKGGSGTLSEISGLTEEAIGNIIDKNTKLSSELKDKFRRMEKK